MIGVAATATSMSKFPDAQPRIISDNGYITPKDKLEGQAEMIQAQRDAKLAAARETRKAKRQAS